MHSRGEKGAKRQKDIFCVNFAALSVKYEFYFKALFVDFGFY